MIFSEFISDEEPFLFWKFVELTWSSHLATNDKSKMTMADVVLATVRTLLLTAVYETVLEHAEQLLSPLVFRCLQLALSLHVHSPSIAMYQQVRLGSLFR